MAENVARRSYDAVSFEQIIYTRNTDILEHLVLLSVIKSWQFYNSIKTRLCPRLPDGRSFRPDFTRADFNHIYSFAAQFWESVSRAPIVGDMSIKADLMELIFSKKVGQNTIMAEDANNIVLWLKEDLATIDIEPEILRTLPDNPLFLKWLEERAIDYEHRRISAQALGRAATVQDFQESLKSVQQSIQPPSSRVVHPTSVFYSNMRFLPPLPTRLTKLNDLLGGGVRHRDTTIVGAISGGGKTILAMQFALDFILNSHNTIVLTTEQPPWQLLMRAISNHLSLEYETFTTRIERATRSSQMAQVDLPYLPDECWNTQDRWDAMKMLTDQADKHLRFLDWSEGGLSLEKDFDAGIDQLLGKFPGWAAEVIIVDWIGGGLKHTGDQGDRLRHFYKAAGETIVNHGKRTGRIMFGMVQLNKTMVKASTKYISMNCMAECKSLADNAANFIAPTALRDDEGRTDDDITGVRMRPFQFMCADKTRHGPTGSTKVLAEFQFQRFSNLPAHIRGGGA